MAEWAIARRGLGQLWMAALAWSLAFGATIASSGLSYASTYRTAAERAQIAATTSSDRGLAVLLGPVAAIGSVGGYTVYKGFVFLTTIGAIWAVLAGTRVLRGAEDAGRWQLGLAGTTDPARATLATIAALLSAVGILLVGTTAIALLAGLDPDLGWQAGDTVLYGLSLALVPAVFVVVGAVSAQIGRTRRVATSLGLGVAAVAFVVRMVADTGTGAHWLLWATPFGWTELMRPFTVNDPWPLLPALVTTVGLACVAAILAGRRDVGDGLLASADVSPVRRFGLGSVTGLSVRLERGVLAGWCLGAVAAALLMGIIAKLTTASIPSSVRDTLDKFGVRGSFADQYLGVAFLLVATVVALLPASQVAAANEEEASGRLVHVLAGAERRSRWFVGRLALTALAIVVAAGAAGVAAWIGARTQGVDVSLGSMLGAGLNVVPTALLVLGIGAVVLAVAPRAAAPVVYGVVIWSLVIDLAGSFAGSLTWLSRLSLFHYMALAPATTPVPATLGWTMAIAAGLGALATWLFDRRDLQLG
jgi:ABC-2 type transport system permease protein